MAGLLYSNCGSRETIFSLENLAYWVKVVNIRISFIGTAERRNKCKEVHRSLKGQLMRLAKESLKKFSLARTRTLTSAIPVQRSNQPTELASQLGACMSLG